MILDDFSTAAGTEGLEGGVVQMILSGGSEDSGRGTRDCTQRVPEMRRANWKM